MHASSTPLRPAALKPRGPALRRAMGLVTLAWVFGSVFVTGTGGATFTVFADKLGPTPFQFGLLAAAPCVAWLASLPASAASASRRMKRKELAALAANRLQESNKT